MTPDNGLPIQTELGHHSDQVVQQLQNIALVIGQLVQAASFDNQFGTTQGSLIYRNSTAWTSLGPGTSGQYLQTLGTAANPQWAGPGGAVLLTSGSIAAAATLALGSFITTKYSYLVLTIAGASSDTATRHPRVQIGHTTVDSTAANYIAGAAFSEASLFNTGFTDQAAAATWSFTCSIFGYQGNGVFPHFIATGKDSAGTFASQTGLYIGSSAGIDALSVIWSGSGSFDAGTYALIGCH